MSPRGAPPAVAAAILLALVLGGCGRDGASDGSPPPSTPGSGATPGATWSPGPSGPVRCETGLRPPAAFRPAGGDRVREADHVGVRESYRDPEGRRLHVTAGISGDFAEGLPTEPLRLAAGSEALLAGAGTDWVVIWEGPEPCVTRTVGGTGFDRDGFLEALREMGVLRA